MFRKNIIVGLFALGVLAHPRIAEAKLAFAIIPWDGAHKVSATDLAKAEAGVVQELTKSGKFTVVDRGQVEKIMAEQAFQISGAVAGNQAEKLGKILSVDKLIQFTILPEGGGDHSGILRVIDVTSGAMEINQTVDSSGNQGVGDSSRELAGLILLKYPLMGKVGKVAGSIVIVDIGSDAKLRDGDRLFVARREIMRDDSGEVIFEDYSRIGTVRIDRAGKVGSKAKVIHLEDTANGPRAGDLVSPAPIPQRPPEVYTTPRLGDYVAGETILQDEFDGERLLGVNNNKDDAYQSGALILDATHKDNGHAYAFYPNKYANLTDFMLEVEAEWYNDESSRLNRFSVSFRSNGDYTDEDSYVVKLYADNTHDFFAWIDGHRRWIQENTTSIGMEVDDGDENKLRVIAVGDHVEVYLNDKFLGGFVDEELDHGTIGLAVNQGCKVGFDDLVVRKVAKKTR